MSCGDDTTLPSQGRTRAAEPHYRRPQHTAATMAAMPDDALELLSSLSLFADLGGPQLEAISHTFEESTFAPGQRILRQGISGSNFYVVVDGDASVKINGEQRASIGRGDFFGEMSLLLGTAPTAGGAPGPPSSS